jgi:hypothetical protein
VLNIGCASQRSTIASDGLRSIQAASSASATRRRARSSALSMPACAPTVISPP